MAVHVRALRASETSKSKIVATFQSSAELKEGLESYLALLKSHRPAGDSALEEEIALAEGLRQALGFDESVSASVVLYALPESLRTALDNSAKNPAGYDFYDGVKHFIAYARDNGFDQTLFISDWRDISMRDVLPIAFVMNLNLFVRDGAALRLSTMALIRKQA